MFSVSVVLTIISAYMGVLFLIALWIENQPGISNKLINSSWIYALSLGVYCTAWTYYGSVGKAAASGMLFLTIYLGPMLSIIFWGVIVKKLVRIKTTHHINSIADFISARYGKSPGVAAIATFVALVGVLPYIALQLKAIFSTFSIITHQSGQSPAHSADLINVLLVVLFIVFTIIMGVRRLDPTERHPGMVGVLVIDNIVKVCVFCAVGIFVTYYLYHGFGDIFRQANDKAFLLRIALDRETVSYATWATYLVLSMSAILFLPRQFHVAVIENSDEKHIRTAMWLFPVYLLLLNIFVYPIAMGGLLHGHTVREADTFVLNLPLEHGAPWLGLLAFIGGFSAASGMIMIVAMTISTMVVNHLLLPFINHLKILTFLRRNLLQVKWLAVVGVIYAGYLFERWLGASYMLVNIGMISFAAVLQFAPAILGGLFWKKGNKIGAMLGLSFGFVAWMYTLLLPSFVKSGWLPQAFVTPGPWGIGFLNPEHLFGITKLDALSHGVFWSLFFNVSAYIIGSTFFSQDVDEQKIADKFVNILKTVSTSSGPRVSKQPHIDSSKKKQVAYELLRQYFSDKESELMVEKCFEEAKLVLNSQISVVELAEFVSALEKCLAGSIGAAAAHQVLKESGIFSSGEAEELQESYVEILASLRVSPEELKAKIDYYQEKERLISRTAKELEKKVQELEENILQRRKAEEALRIVQNELERRVEERTVDLVRANESLRVEILERKKTEEALRNSEGRLLYAQMIARLGDWEWNVVEDRMACSEEALRIYGRSRDEFKGSFESFLSFVHPDDVETVKKIVREAFLQREAAIVFEHRVVKAGVKETMVRVDAKILFEENGNVTKVIGTTLDITELKKAEEELRQNYETQGVINKLLSLSLTEISVDELLWHALDQILSVKWLAFEQKGAIFLVEEDPHALVMKASVGLDELTQKKCMAVPFGKCVCGATASARKIQYAECHEERCENAAEINNPHKHYCVPVMFGDITLGVINMYLSPLHKQNYKEEEFLSTVAYVLAGILMRKKAERELKVAYEQLRETQSQLIQSSKMAAVGQLASGVAHEINNPLTGVLNNVQLIKLEMEQLKACDPASFKDLLSVVEESALRCKNIVRSLLDFSHASTGMFQIVSLNEVIMKVVLLIGHEMKLQSVNIITHLQDDLFNIMGDPQLLQQVIFNLISNARWAIHKKDPKAGGAITISTQYIAESEVDSLTVSDTGIGISKANLEHLFEPFFTTKPVGEGTGLGLAFVYKIIKEHKGNIEVESKEGEGTTFRICLPSVSEKTRV